MFPPLDVICFYRTLDVGICINCKARQFSPSIKYFFSKHPLKPIEDIHIDLTSFLLHQDKHRTCKIVVKNLKKKRED